MSNWLLALALLAGTGTVTHATNATHATRSVSDGPRVAGTADGTGPIPTRSVSDGPRLAGSAPAPLPLAELSEAGDPVVETVVSADGSAAAYVTRGQDGDTLWVGNDRRANCEELAQVSFTAAGSLAWWCRNGDEQSVYFEDASSGPFLDVSLPNLDALSALSVPTPVEWGFRAGTRSVLAAKDARGEWQSYFRYSAAPSVQERRGLPTTATVSPGPDASVQKARTIRYRLVAGSVPLFIGKSKREECVYIGTEAVGCGQQVAMLVWASETERLAFAASTSEGLVVHAGALTWGPTRNLDWVAFSPDGYHLAFVMREGDGQVLVVDDERQATWPVIESVVWTPDNRLVYLGHDDSGAHLVVAGKEVLLRDLVSAVYVSPVGQVSASGRHKGKAFLSPAGEGFPDFESLWGEGFLAGGELYGVLRLAGGRQALLLGGKVSEPFDGIARITPSSDGRRLTAVGSTPDGDRLLVDGVDSSGELSGRAEQLGWCGPDRVLVRERKGDTDCAYSGKGLTFCCPRMVMSACGSEGLPDFVCLDGGKYWLYRGGEKVGEAYDEIPPHLMWQDLAGGTFDFGARRGTDWFLVTGGRERPAAGRPLTIRPFLDAPWFLVSGKEGSRWMTREGDGPWFTSVSPPFDMGGSGVYRARQKGEEFWVLRDGRLGPAAEILSAPIPVAGGMAWWERSGGRRALMFHRLSGKPGRGDAGNP